MADDELETKPEFSTPLVTRNQDGTGSLEWTARGYRRCTLVSDDLLEDMHNERNRMVRRIAALEVENSTMRDAIWPGVTLRIKTDFVNQEQP